MSVDDTYSPAWLLAVTTGLRRGEPLGLRWEDIDLQRGRLHVRQNLIELGSVLQIQEPKTKSSRRAIPLTQSAWKALKEHRARQVERRLRLGPVWRGNDPVFGDLVFTTVDGGPVGPRNFYRRFRELSTAAGLPMIPLHGLRHAAATLMLQEGVPTKVVSERLGHSSIALTLDTYSHVLPDMQDAATAAIEAALSRPVRDAM